MHVENRVTRALMLANEFMITNELCDGSTESEKTDTLERLTIMTLLAELINAVQGLDYEGKPQSTTGSAIE